MAMPAMAPVEMEDLDLGDGGIEGEVVLRSVGGMVMIFVAGRGCV